MKSLKYKMTKDEFRVNKLAKIIRETLKNSRIKVSAKKNNNF